MTHAVESFVAYGRYIDVAELEFIYTNPEISIDMPTMTVIIKWFFIENIRKVRKR
jgi:hypothetical protein